LGLLSPNDFLGSIDLKDAYFLISIFVEHQKYLRFKFKGKIFQFLCLPFGLCTSPYTFTKVMKPIMYKIRKFAELLGVLTSACPAVAYGFIHCKRLERQKFLALKFNGGNYERKILITDSMMEDLVWWRINAIIGSCPIRTHKYTLEIFSDSSLSGWGCYCKGKEAFGFWNKEERKNHINYLELLAAFFAIKCFTSKLSNQEFLLRLDNTTAIAYINRAGGVQYPHLTSYTTLNTARSTISLISAYDINNDGLISRFLKSVFKQRPSKPKYNSTWDVVPVLKYIEKMHPLSQFKLKEAAEKVATLLALTTAQRLQTLALVRIENIERTKTEIKIKITELTKTTKPGSVYPELVLPFYTDRPGLCTLFIGSTKPYGPASSQTIGHWIKSLLGKAGVDTNQFSAYSTRHAAVSTAHKRGVDISTIRRCAGWTP
ncbi:GSCOCG00011431001-RA-CDS, partial [Cotesia congregata]